MKLVAQSLRLLTMLMKDSWPSLQNVARSFSKIKKKILMLITLCSKTTTQQF